MAAMGARAGTPDLAFVIDGAAKFIELKTRRGSLSKAQKECHAAIVRAGGEVVVVRCVDSAADTLRRWRAIA